MRLKICLRYILSIAAFFAASALNARAQVELTLRIEPSKALLHETVTAFVEIDNNTSEAIHLGSGQNHAALEFEISDMNGNHVSKRPGMGPVSSTLTIEPFQSRTIATDIVSYYQISQPRPYKVACDLLWKGNAYQSKQTYFDVLPGILISSKTVQLPGENVIVRKFSLIYMHRDNRAKLFLRVDNPEGTICYGVYNLGDYIRIQDAEMEVDGLGKIHLLYQSGPRRFTYHVLNAHGKTEDSKFYAGTAGKIELSRTSGGKIFIEGGQKYEGDSYSEPYEFKQNRIFE